MSFNIGDKVAKIEYPVRNADPMHINGPYWIIGLYEAYRERWANLAQNRTGVEYMRVPLRGLVPWNDATMRPNMSITAAQLAALRAGTATNTQPGPAATHATSPRSASSRSRRGRSHSRSGSAKSTSANRSANHRRRPRSSTGHRGGKRTRKQRH